MSKKKTPTYKQGAKGSEPRNRKAYRIAFRLEMTRDERLTTRNSIKTKWKEKGLNGW